MERHIPVIVDENLQIQTMRETLWVLNFDLMICNTINYHVFLSDRATEIPAVWWLHDSVFFYDGVEKRILRGIDTNKLDIVSVGPVPRNAMQTFVLDLPIRDLLYGVVDEKGKRNDLDTGKKSGRFRFMTIGYIESRKGQDVLIAAVKLLRKEILSQCEFYLVGQDTSMLAEQIKDEIKNIPQVVMKGSVGRVEINRLLRETDMMICPSREDPMPTVVAEAMMHSVPCILSDAAGTAAYISNGENGLIFVSEDSKELAEKIEWCVLHKENAVRMGSEARIIYENIFSMNVFERNLLETVDRNIR